MTTSALTVYKQEAHSESAPKPTASPSVPVPADKTAVALHIPYLDFHIPYLDSHIPGCTRLGCTLPADILLGFGIVVVESAGAGVYCARARRRRHRRRSGRRLRGNRLF